jgi:hypothetical protein
VRQGGGKAKGSAFERFICKRLSLWVSHGERDDLFWRSAMSGGRATLQLRQDIVNKAQSGDMTAIAPEGYELCEKCLFECKNYRDLQIAQGLIKDIGYFATFWDSTNRAALRFDKVPILIMKQNHFPVLLVCPITCQIFEGQPIVEQLQWGVAIYLLEDAVEIKSVANARRRSVVALNEPRTQQSQNDIRISSPTNRRVRL